MVKLSPTQQNIVDLMKNGWELGVHCGWGSRGSIQKGGIGKGGEARAVSLATIWALEKKEIIQRRKKDYFLYVFIIKTGGENEEVIKV